MVVALIFLFVSTPVATRDLGYQGLVQKTRGSNLYVLNVGGRAGYYLSLCIGFDGRYQRTSGGHEDNAKTT